MGGLFFDRITDDYDAFFNNFIQWLKNDSAQPHPMRKIMLKKCFFHLGWMGFLRRNDKKKMFHFIKLGWFFNSTALVHWWQNCIQLINILYCNFFRYAKLSILTRICSRKKNNKIKIIFNMYINNSDEIESRLNELNNMQIFFSYFCVLKNVHKIPVNIWLRKSGCFVIFNYIKCEW